MKRYRHDDSSLQLIEKRQKKQVNEAEKEELPLELWTHEIMGHLSQKGHVIEIARLASACKRLYTFPWRSLCKRIIQYIPHWTQETLTPFVPFVEEMLWNISIGSLGRISHLLNFQECRSLKRLHIMCRSNVIPDNAFTEPFLPLQLEELVMGPHINALNIHSDLFPLNLKRIAHNSTGVFGQSLERFDSFREAWHIAFGGKTSAERTRKLDACAL